ATSAATASTPSTIAITSDAFSPLVCSCTVCSGVAVSATSSGAAEGAGAALACGVEGGSGEALGFGVAFPPDGLLLPDTVEVVPCTTWTGADVPTGEVETSGVGAGVCAAVL